jgi:hypothetical protein
MRTMVAASAVAGAAPLGVISMSSPRRALILPALPTTSPSACKVR